MRELLVLLAISLCLAWCSQRNIGYIRTRILGRVDIPLVVMVIMLSLFCGLRTNFNDTYTYISSFENAVTPMEYLGGEIELLGNPLFYFMTSVFRHYISGNYHTYLLTIAFFTISCLTWFIRKYSDDFMFSVVLFFSVGLYISCFAAVKQMTAIAILTIAIDKLLQRKYVWFYLLVFVAMLFHTYAIMLVILPLFIGKPWSGMVYLTLAVVLFVLFTFETTITNFLEYASELGKDISETEVFDTQQINILRLSVFGVPSLLSFIFRKRINYDIKSYNSLLINMSTLSFLVMLLGLQSAGNLFGRSAIYFELGTIVALPYIINVIFEKRSAQIVKLMAGLCYLLFFLFDRQSFAAEYRAISLMEYLRTL